MFNPTQLVIDTFVEQMKAAYVRTYGLLEPEYPNVIAFVGRIALENIANSDAPYHDVNHTILVTEVGQEILKGRHISQGGVGPRDWLHFVISLLCHDIGYVRGVCFGDRDGTFHNFGSRGFIIKVFPVRAGQHIQTKLFETGGWWGKEDKIPGRLYFDLDQKSEGFSIDLPQKQ